MIRDWFGDVLKMSIESSPGNCDGAPEETGGCSNGKCPGKILLIVGGQSAEKTEDKAFALSLHPSVEVPSCMTSICDFPHYVRGTSTAVFDDNLPTVCGGRNESPWTYYNQCFKLNLTNNGWELSGSKDIMRVHTGKK